LDTQTSFSTLLEYNTEYEALDSATQLLINIAYNKAAMEMNNLEKAAVEACSNLRSAMKSKDNFQLDMRFKEDYGKIP